MLNNGLSLTPPQTPVYMYIILLYILVVQRIRAATNLQIILKHTRFLTVNSPWPIDFRRMLWLTFPTHLYL
jgi:hypothetical protein